MDGAEGGGRASRWLGGRAEAAAFQICFRGGAGRVCVGVPWVGVPWAGARAAACAEVGCVECGSESPLDCSVKLGAPARQPVPVVAVAPAIMLCSRICDLLERVFGGG